MKVLKISNIILFTIICLIQCFALYVLVASFIPLISGDPGGILAVFLALMPIYIICVVAIAILSIVLTITTKVLNKKLISNNLPISKIFKICKILALSFVLFDLIMFIVIFVMGKSN